MTFLISGSSEAGAMIFFLFPWPYKNLQNKNKNSCRCWECSSHGAAQYTIYNTQISIVRSVVSLLFERKSACFATIRHSGLSQETFSVGHDSFGELPWRHDGSPEFGGMPWRSDGSSEFNGISLSKNLRMKIKTCFLVIQYILIRKFFILFN